MKRVLEYLEQSKNWLSKITKRKIFILSFGLMFSIMVPPLMTVVSCSESVATQTYRRFSIAKDAVIFDISKLDPQDLISGILGTIGTQMKVPAYDMTPSSSEKYELVREYLQQANFSKEIIRLKNGNETYPLDFKDVHANLDKLKEIANKFSFDQLDKSIGYKIGAAANGIYAVDLTKVILKAGDVTSLADFINMYDPQAIPTRPANSMDFDVMVGTIKAGDPVPDESKILATHPYLNLLKAYHAILYPFFKSDFYSKWIVGKSFIVAKNDSKIGTAGVRDLSGTQTVVLAGELYDQPNSLIADQVQGFDLKTMKATVTSTYAKESSNLEFQFFYNLLDLN